MEEWLVSSAYIRFYALPFSSFTEVKTKFHWVAAKNFIRLTGEANDNLGADLVVDRFCDKFSLKIRLK